MNVIEPFLSKVLTGFRENHNTQHSLLKMLENFKESSDKDNSFSANLMDLCKAFTTLNHDLQKQPPDVFCKQRCL